MSERFKVRIIKKEGWRGLADHFIATIYDQQNGLMVACAGDTQEECEGEAAKQLAILSHRQRQLANELGCYLPWRY
jgi:hypothetical protein